MERIVILLFIAVSLSRNLVSCDDGQQKASILRGLIREEAESKTADIGTKTSNKIEPLWKNVASFRRTESQQLDRSFDQYNWILKAANKDRWPVYMGRERLLSFQKGSGQNAVVKTASGSLESTRKRRSVGSATETKNEPEHVVFSAWETWMRCDASCESKGFQVRTRKCYSLQNTAIAGLSCNYGNLVDSRPCVGRPCNTDVDLGLAASDRFSAWTKWSPCSVTCGKGGQQLRTRSCLTSSPRAAESTLRSCAESTQEIRSCQYTTSCATWDEWGAWSACSATCGIGGTIRSRKCIVHSYFGGKASKNGTTDPAIGHQHLGTDQDSTNKINEKGILFITREQNSLYLVDAEALQNQGALDVNGSSLNEELPRKEIVDSSLCESKDGTFEERSVCVATSACNTSQWSSWLSWSACSTSCGTGISRKERQCLSIPKAGSCEGRKILYRRCYQPPCWSSWSEEPCSATCGPGYRRRSRRCIQPTLVNPFGPCPGRKKDVQKCFVKSCFGGSWAEWSKFGPCSATCNGGFKHRNRTCNGTVCFGKAHELVQCNKQQCPTWSRWSAFSCCNVSCGRGIRERFRTCNGGKVGEDGCDGITRDAEYCYREACGGDQSPPVHCGRRAGKYTVQLRIFGGKASEREDWPWQASWQHRSYKSREWKHFCGGTLIHPRWIVTAGHCIKEAPFAVNIDEPGQSWSIVLGMSKLYKDGVRYYAERIFVHPDYEHATVTNSDIAMIKLRRMAEISNSIAPVCLPGKREPEPGEKCVITGWGFTAPGGNHSETLLDASIPIVDFGVCLNFGMYYRHFLRKGIHMCAGDPGDSISKKVSSDSCTGDSGGPLLCKNNSQWYVTAVTSFGFADCGTPNHVGIYTPVKTFQPWIRRNMERYTYDKC